MTKSVNLWAIKLRTDQVRLLAEVLDYVVARQQARIDTKGVPAIDIFSHRLAKTQILDLVETIGRDAGDALG